MCRSFLCGDLGGISPTTVLTSHLPRYKAQAALGGKNIFRDRGIKKRKMGWCPLVQSKQKESIQLNFRSTSRMGNICHLPKGR